MRIDASALKANYGIPDLQENGSPLLGGSRTAGVRATRLNVSAPPVNTADQFAKLIAQKTVAPDNTGEVQKGDKESKNPDELAGALANAADFIENKFGHDAATAFKGIVIANSGDRITEDSLSDGLLKSIQFIDRNFGFAAGDQVMAHFNSNLNNAMNNYFENGLQEHFFATTPGAGAQTTLQNTLAQVNKEFGEATAKSIESLIDQVLKEDGNSLEALKKGLEKGLNAAEKLSPGISAKTGPLAAGEIMDNLQGNAGIVPPAPGSVLNLSV
ncbi:hypothetical protein [Maridesulfovibrio hydrothermalis]|uniref:DUF5610 domain-containing protein n=1 Tax=Maridesulfovibrio hydrothermalis AM13 = DSM 14728 TaxID=1121451 RepID=L0R943_9BACT|nr:hypothetical protein [Maridesulfovibrio hydrothermalis]CCO22742.1 conserved protein of unknown function [Maridesulfovibrio hydrothermalis AM13 = DSM 14728]